MARWLFQRWTRKETRRMLGTFRYALSGGPMAVWSLMLLRQLRRTERFDRQAIRWLQAAKLGRLLRTATERVPHWRELASRRKLPFGGSPAREILANWPILTKATLCERPMQFLSPGYPAWALQWRSTGGSTGKPLRFARSLSNSALVTAALLRGWLWRGVRPADRGVRMKGYSRTSITGHVRMWIGNWRTVDFRDGSADRSREIIRQFRPKFLAGYPTELLRLLDGLGTQVPPVPVVFSTGEVLYPDQRERLQQAFGAVVSDHYGCTEVGSLAFECERGVKHLTEEHVIVETVDADGQPVCGKPGRLLLTDLDNFAMPLIRYEVGDMGVINPAPCPCGRSLLTLGPLEGRMEDRLEGRNGRSLPACFLARRFQEMRSIKAYQLEQTSWDSVTLRFVPSGQAGVENELNAIRAEILSQLGKEVVILARECESIPRTAFGKTRLVVGMNLGRGAGG